MMKVRSRRKVNKIKDAVAEALEINPELVSGYLVVGYMADDSVRAAHNTCCIAHVINHVRDSLAEYPELNTVNPATLLGPKH